MSNTLCVYNTIHGSFNRREIRMLAHALGLPEDRLEHRLNKLGLGETILISDLLHVLKQGAFKTDIHRMFNSQSGTYNSLVLVKTLQLVDSHVFSFHEIHKARLAFDVYEMNALRNDKNTFDLILYTIKSCDYRISPIKLRHRLYHYHLNKTRILHLCEYFDLLLMSDRIDKKAELDAKKIIDIANPKSVDQQLIDEMDAKYLDEEQNGFFQEVYPKEKLIENSVWPAKIAWQNQVNEAALQKAQLRKQLTASIFSLKQSRTGSACTSPGHSLYHKFCRPRPATTVVTTRLDVPSLPIVERLETSTNNVQQCPQSNTTEIVSKGTEIAERIQRLRSQSSFLEFKYALQREDYINELFPNGYSKSVTVSTTKPIERRIKTAKPSMYWTNQCVTK
ncbi:hypothetical protein I4U23_007906 [Adineta vaga]|nr:hypothetical protein I4U23_007906 [Adineta vaga]